MATGTWRFMRGLAPMGCMLFLVFWATGCRSVPPTGNPVAGIGDRQKLKMIYSLQEVDPGRLYQLDYTADYKLDELMEQDCATTADLMGFIQQALFDKPLAGSLAYGAACSAFMAQNPVDGHFLMGRNYDYEHGTDIAAILVRTAPKGKYKSISLVDAMWLGYPHDFYTDGVSDLSMLMGVPYSLMDGMNEKGFAVGVLMLHGAATCQDQGRPNILTTVAMRYLLDNAQDVEEAIALLKGFDMHSSTPDTGSYHFLIADAAGNAATVEYVLEDGQTHPNTLEVLQGPDYQYVTNFYTSPKMDQKPNGRFKAGNTWRYHKLDSVLRANDFQLDPTAAMKLLGMVSQTPTEKKTSHTQWSVVYELAKREATVSLLQEYDKTYAFSIK